jgi:hypothetical protein
MDPNKNETVLGRYGYRRCITIDGADVLNVREGRLENPIAPKGGITIRGRHYRQGEPVSDEDYELVRPIIPGQLCRDTFLAHCDDPDARWAECFAHGRFPAEDPMVQVVLSSWFDRHFAAWAVSKPRVTCFALDLADSEHGDRTMLAAGSAEGLAALHDRQHEGAMETVAWVLTTVQMEYGVELAHGEVPLVVDADGMGRAVCSRLKELGVRVVEYRGNDPPDDKRRYVNRRAEGYGVLAARLDPKGVWANVPWAMPADSQLVQDLCAPEKVFDSDGFRFKITPKSRQPGMPDKAHTLREKLGRSPDRGDSCVMLHWGIHSEGSMVTQAISRWKLQSAIKWDGPADTGNRGCHLICAAAHEDRRFGTVGLALVGLNEREQAIDLLTVDGWKDRTYAELAADIKAICEPHRINGLAVNKTASSGLWEALVRVNAPLFDSTLGPAERKELATSFVDALDRRFLRIFRHDELFLQTAMLNMEYGIDAPTLADPLDTSKPIELAMGLATAVMWAMRSLREDLGEL